MSKLRVEIDYNVAKTVILGMRHALTEIEAWLKKIEDMLDKAALTATTDASVKSGAESWPNG